MLEFSFCGLSRRPFEPGVDEGLSLYIASCKELHLLKYDHPRDDDHVPVCLGTTPPHHVYRCHLRAGLEVTAPALHTLRVRCRDPPNSDQLTHLRLLPCTDAASDAAILRRPPQQLIAQDLEFPATIDVKLFVNVEEDGLDRATMQHLRSHPRVALVTYLQPADMWGDPDAWL